MKKMMMVLILIAVFFSGISVFPAQAAEKVVFVDRDFSSLRSGFLADRGGLESVGAYAEEKFRFWSVDGMLSNGGGYYVGYITYKVSAPTSQQIDSLKLDLVGRISTYDDGGVTAQEWVDRYWMRIYVFKDQYEYKTETWTDYEDHVAIMPEITPNVPDTAQEYSFDLSQWAKGGKDVYVTIALYSEWTPSWVGFSHLTLSGTTAALAVATPTTKATPTTAASSSSKSSSQASSQASSEEASSEAESTGTSDETSVVSEDGSAEESQPGSEEISSEAISSEDENSEATSSKSEEAGDDEGSAWWIVLAAAVVVVGGIAAYVLIRKRNRK